jgi:hypothetical protein
MVQIKLSSQQHLLRNHIPGRHTTSIPYIAGGINGVSSKIPDLASAGLSTRATVLSPLLKLVQITRASSMHVSMFVERSTIFDDMY